VYFLLLCSSATVEIALSSFIKDLSCLNQRGPLDLQPCISQIWDIMEMKSIHTWLSHHTAFQNTFNKDLNQM
jgi:hypothetical protein